MDVSGFGQPVLRIAGDDENHRFIGLGRALRLGFQPVRQGLQADQTPRAPTGLAGFIRKPDVTFQDGSGSLILSDDIKTEQLHIQATRSLNLIATIQGTPFGSQGRPSTPFPA